RSPGGQQGDHPFLRGHEASLRQRLLDHAAAVGASTTSAAPSRSTPDALVPCVGAHHKLARRHAYSSSATRAAARLAPSPSTSRYSTVRPISCAIASAITSGEESSKSIRRPAP